MIMQRQIETQKDDRLADFTDRLLGGETTPTASNSDEELLSLEKTLLRLNHVLPSAQLEEARVEQMLARLKARVKREEEERAARPSFWRRLFDFQSNPQAGLLIGVAAAILLLVVFPWVSLTDPGVTGTAGAGSAGTSAGVNLFVGVGVALFLLALYWISRRK
ncbi:MAG: hypothetical protein DCC59_05690 [Chloroflexi bacterium]|nr:hypothetical protein [Chloroflexi bacterium CFX1]MCQ3954024.1 hypothetical protein [Chloroflexota bacterium]RIK53945.1 MAG: hypothetical protein DCC59_05690 [Chloroflexota bacterium]